ncbi:MAG TPA: hypothetical protein VH120_10085 [Gemmataceae bacterium]|nr:hypothetical protein [Gemmataceae bacterium]
MVLAALVVAVIAGPAVAQSERARFGEGTQAFRLILGALGVSPPPEGNHLLDQPQNRILIVFGRTDVLDRFLPGDLKQFILDGGAVLIATDRRTSDELFREIGVQISGETLTTEPGGGVAYRGSLTECPLVWEYGRPPGSPRPPSGFLFQGMGHEPTVASNLPSGIDRARGVKPLATLFSRGHPVPREIIGRFPTHTSGESLFAVESNSRLWGKGRLLVMADHSVFINDMIMQPDNDNWRFAWNAVDWLCDAGDGRRRTQVALLNDGNLETDFRPSLTMPQPQLSLEDLVPLADQALVGLERENAFNQMLLEATGGLWPILRTLALALTLALLVFGLYRFMQARYRPESRPSAKPAATGNDGLTAIERRQQAVIAQGNLAEAARELAHQAFAAVGLTPSAEAPPPAVTVPGWFPFRHLRWGREVRSLWTLAAQGPTRRVSPAGLRRLDATLRELLGAVAAGRVRLAGSDSAI